MQSSSGNVSPAPNDWDARPPRHLWAVGLLALAFACSHPASSEFPEAGGSDTGVDGGPDADPADTVRCEDSVPNVVSTPPLYGIVGAPYTYSIRSNAGDEVSLTLLQGPDGMHIVDGVVVWTPSQPGPAAVRIGTEFEGNRRTLCFEVQVASTVPAASGVVGADGGTVTVDDSTSPLFGLQMIIEPGMLSSEETFTIALLGGTVQPLPDGLEPLGPAFVVLPEIPGVEATFHIPIPASATFQELEMPVGVTLAGNPSPWTGGIDLSHPFDDVLVLLDDLDPTETRWLRHHIALSAKYITLASGRFLRLEGPRANLYWNVDPDQAPPTELAQSFQDHAAASMAALAEMGCDLPPNRVAIFVTDFTKAWDGFAHGGGLFLRRELPASKRAYVIAHEVFHIIQHSMVPAPDAPVEQKWWLEALAVFAADEIANDNQYLVQSAPWNQSVIGNGLSGRLKDIHHAYRLGTFFKHLKATRDFNACGFLRAQAPLLREHRLPAALEATTSASATSLFSDFAAVYSVHRTPSLIDDAASLNVEWSPPHLDFGGDPMSWSASSRGADVGTVGLGESPRRLRLTIEDHGPDLGSVRVVREVEGALVELADIPVSVGATVDLPALTGQLTLVATATDGASDTPTAAIVEIAGLSDISGSVLDVDGLPAAAAVRISSDSTAATTTSSGGHFSFAGAGSAAIITVTATCATDPTITATARISANAAVVDAGTIRLPGSCAIPDCPGTEVCRYELVEAYEHFDRTSSADPSVRNCTTSGTDGAIIDDDLVTRRNWLVYAPVVGGAPVRDVANEFVLRRSERTRVRSTGPCTECLGNAVFVDEKTKDISYAIVPSTEPLGFSGLPAAAIPVTTLTADVNFPRFVDTEDGLGELELATITFSHMVFYNAQRSISCDRIDTSTDPLPELHAPRSADAMSVVDTNRLYPPTPSRHLVRSLGRETHTFRSPNQSSYRWSTERLRLLAP